MAEKFIQKMHLKKGAFTAQAEEAGEGVQEYADDVIKKKKAGKPVVTKTLKRALLAKTFSKMAKKHAMHKGMMEDEGAMDGDENFEIPTPGKPKKTHKGMKVVGD